MNSYASLSELRAYFDFGDNGNDINTTLRGYLIQASRAVDRYTRKEFFPKRRTLYFDSPPDGRTVKFPHFFVELIGLSGNAGASGIGNDVLLKRCGDDWNLTPYNIVEIDDSSGSILNWSGTPRRSVVADVIETYRTDYEVANEAWVDSGASLLDDLSASNNMIYSSASNAYNALGFNPRFKSEQIWKIGSGSAQEFMYVLNTGASGGSPNYTHVIRGINGTTALDHASGQAIYVWEPEYEIKINTMRLARWIYEIRNNPTGTRHFFPQIGGFELADAWPKDIRDALDRYRGVSISSF